MTNGFKKNKQPTTKERLRKIEADLENVSQALQLANMMVKHLNNKNQGIETDLNNSMGIINDFQYRTLAMLELATYSKDDLDAKAEELKLKDFYEASVKEDAEKEYTDNTASIIHENSIVILTSKIKDADDEDGILRSKFHMEKCLTPNIREALLGSKVGDKVEVELNGKNHIIEVLEHKKAPAVEATEEESTESASE